MLQDCRAIKPDDSGLLRFRRSATCDVLP